MDILKIELFDILGYPISMVLWRHLNSTHVTGTSGLLVQNLKLHRYQVKAV